MNIPQQNAQLILQIAEHTKMHSEGRCTDFEFLCAVCMLTLKAQTPPADGVQEYSHTPIAF